MKSYVPGAAKTADGVSYRIWAPDQQTLAIQIVDREAVPLARDEQGYHAGLVPDLRPNSKYYLRLENGDLIADPCSRFQPEGPHGPSEYLDPDTFCWTDSDWAGRDLESCVIYEMHIGTLTEEGTWKAAIGQLQELADIGITCIELMPVAEFPGRWGWGYDGVNLFAPFHHYGTPDDFKMFVDRAHRLGICVILDVVYNHLGPDGNHLKRLSSAYFSKTHRTDWGEAINFDGPDSAPVREFFLANAAYWIEQFHLDGLRLDATQDIHDDSPIERHILTDLGKVARAAAASRKILIIAENEPQNSLLCRPIEKGGHGLDAVWNDDFHHSAFVALTGRREAYYSDYKGDPQEFVSAAKYGYLYQGQWYSWQKNRRGRPSFDLPQSRFITFIQNHDQIANSARGERAHKVGSPGRYRALTALTLLGSGTPMLFQGQEFSASTPFLYFADHRPELAKLVTEGRRKFLSQFPSIGSPEALDIIAVPGDLQTFLNCKLKPSERASHTQESQLIRDLIAIRKSDDCFRSADRMNMDGAVIEAQAFILRYFVANGHDRMLVVNLGRDLQLQSVPEPLVACPPGWDWECVLSTESPNYGGGGVAESENEQWRIPGEAALFLALKPQCSKLA